MKIKGIWIFNDIISLDQSIFGEYLVNFTSDGVECMAMRINDITGDIELSYIPNKGSSTPVYVLGVSWVDADYNPDDKYRTVDFGETEQEVSEVFYNWLIANATEYGTTPTLRNVRVNGKVYRLVAEGEGGGAPQYLLFNFGESGMYGPIHLAWLDADIETDMITNKSLLIKAPTADQSREIVLSSSGGGATCEIIEYDDAGNILNEVSLDRGESVTLNANTVSLYVDVYK